MFLVVCSCGHAVIFGSLTMCQRSLISSAVVLAFRLLEMSMPKTAATTYAGSVGAVDQTSIGTSTFFINVARFCRKLYRFCCFFIFAWTKKFAAFL